MSISLYHFSVHGLTANLMTLENRQMSRKTEWTKGGELIFCRFFTVIPVPHFFQQIFVDKSFLDPNNGFVRMPFTGTVTFLSEKEQFMADIQADGTFSPGVVKDGGGIPSGVYKICITAYPRGYTATPRDYTKKSQSGSSDPGAVIHAKYASADTSGLTIDTSKTKTLDLVLDPP